MDVLKRLATWAKEQGLILDGITIKQIPDRGIGIVATRRLKPGETILTVPIGSIRCLNAIPDSISRRLRPSKASIQGLLAAHLALDQDAMSKTPWGAVLPKFEDFKAAMPFMWPEELQTLLPEMAKLRLEIQQAKFTSEWSIVTNAIPEIRQEDYVWAWFVINTRTFYHETPSTLEYPWDDRLALIPVADLFNHADAGCRVLFTPDEYTIIADRVYEKGDEVNLCYGEHSNDYLLAEYGFIPDSGSRWDKVSIGDVILPLLCESHRRELQNKGFSEIFALHAAELEICPNTRAALRLLCCTKKQWLRFADEGHEEEDGFVRDKVDDFLTKVLNGFLVAIRKMLRRLERVPAGESSQRHILQCRWNQIETCVTEMIQSLET